MPFLDTVKCSLNTAVDTITAITHNIVEKNRTNAQLNRLRLVMKNESEMINRAYIALGKHYYESTKSEKGFFPSQNENELFDVIESSKQRIKKARERYSQILENQTVEIYKYDSDDALEDITVACSNEDEYDDSPFEGIKDEPVKDGKSDAEAEFDNKEAKKNAETNGETEENFSF